LEWAIEEALDRALALWVYVVTHGCWCDPTGGEAGRAQRLNCELVLGGALPSGCAIEPAPRAIGATTMIGGSTMLLAGAGCGWWLAGHRLPPWTTIPLRYDR